MRIQLLAILLVFGASSAAAQPVTVEDSSADYSTSMIYTDAAAVGLIGIGFAIALPGNAKGTVGDTGEGIMAVGATVWVAGALINHASRGELDRAALSTAVRLSLPFALAFGGEQLAGGLRCIGSCDVFERSDAESIGIGAGLLVAGTLATALDHFWLSKSERVVAPTVAPRLDGQPGMVAGLGGTF